MNRSAACSPYSKVQHCLKALKQNFRIRSRHRVPVILQLSATECGLASLAMILNFYGRKTTVSECRNFCPTGRDGTTARSIVEVAQALGLQARAHKVELDDLKYIRTPAIIHWRFSHFVVLEQWRDKKALIVDPAGGRRQVGRKEFDEAFTGIVLTFQCSEPLVKNDSDRRKPWMAYLRGMLAQPKALGVVGQVLFCSLLVQVLSLALPFFTKELFDYVIPFRSTAILTILVLGITAILVADSTVGYLREILLLYLRRHLDARMMAAFIEHLLALPFPFFQQRTAGDLLLRIDSNSFIRETLTGRAMSMMLDASFMLTYLIILLRMEPTFGLVVTGIAALQILVAWITGPAVRRLIQSELAAKSGEQSYAVEVLRGIATIKGCGAEDRVLTRWSDLMNKYLNASIARTNLSVIAAAIIGSFRKVSPFLILWLGTSRVLDNTMTVGTLLAINSIAVFILNPVGSLVDSAQQLHLVGAHLDRLADVLAANPEQRSVAPIRRCPLSGALEVDSLTFNYPGRSRPALSNVSFSLLPGQRLGVVGPTGSGKSTLAFILLGLYLPTSGEIRYDGIPLNQYDRKWLRSQIGVVLQESFSFSGSIRQNIALNKPDMSLEELIRVSKLASIHDQIWSMPMGYETTLIEGGVSISGGERQRIAIARALALDPKILILDEATSHMDVATESIVHSNLSSLTCTRIVIAHRLTTVRNADTIVVLREGSIIEHGTHDQLMVHDGHYADLVRRQDPTRVSLPDDSCAAYEQG